MAFEQQKSQLVSGLAAVADSMRKCAEFADAFAALVTGDVSADSPAVHVLRDLTVAIDDKTPGNKRKRKGDATEDADAPKRRKRKPKDPNAPKRFASSYIFFQNEVRKELKARHPNMSNNELLGLISRQWQTLSEEEKAVYHQAMADAKERYSQDKRAYDSRNAEEAEAASAAAIAAPNKKVRKSVKATPAEVKAGPAAVEKRVVALASPSSEASEAFASEESDEDDEHVSTSSGEEVSKPGRKEKSQPSVTSVTSGSTEKKKKVKA